MHPCAGHSRIGKQGLARSRPVERDYWITNAKETDVSISNKRAETGNGIVLLDCGRASKVTRGFPFLVFVEYGWAPFDRLLI